MTVTTAAAATASPVGRRRRIRAMAIALLLAALLGSAAAYAAVRLVRPEPLALPVDAPTELPATDVAAAAKLVGHDVYGVATPPGARLELTRGSRGEVWVRYLHGGAKAGDRRPAFLTVGTYRRPGALAALRAAAKGERMRTAALPGGAMLWSRDRPTSVYLARPGGDLLVEVYSPDARQARGLVRGGAVLPLR